MSTKKSGAGGRSRAKTSNALRAKTDTHRPPVSRQRKSLFEMPDNAPSWLADDAPRAEVPLDDAPDVPDDLVPGEVVADRWRLVRELGVGGMGSVWEAEHVGNGRHAALKFLHRGLADVPAYRDTFAREGLVDDVVDRAARPPVPRGPGAVEAYDSGEHRGQPFLVLEMLRGGSVADAPMPADPAAVASVMDDVLRVLEVAHDRGIVHRDLKPENLFIGEDGDVRVLDWGLAQIPGDRAPGGAVGTIGYAPPEQLLGLSSTPASDVYGTSATAYALLTGRLPVDPVAQGEFLGKIAGRPTLQRLARDLWAVPGCPSKSVLEYAPNTPPHLAAAIDHALACDPADRPQDARAMRADLERAMTEEMVRPSRRVTAA